MSQESQLLHLIYENIANHFDVSPSELAHTDVQSTNANRGRVNAKIILIIELLMHEHRKKYKSYPIDLSGVNALNHMIFLKTNWKPSDIRELNQRDKLDTFLTNYYETKLPEKTQTALSVLRIPESFSSIDLDLLTPWVIGSGDRYLRFD